MNDPSVSTLPVAPDAPVQTAVPATVPPQTEVGGGASADLQLQVQGFGSVTIMNGAFVADPNSTLVLPAAPADSGTQNDGSSGQ